MNKTRIASEVARLTRAYNRSLKRPWDVFGGRTADMKQKLDTLNGEMAFVGRKMTRYARKAGLLTIGGSENA